MVFARLVAVAVAALLASACSFAWEDYEPGTGGRGGASSSAGSDATGGSTTSSSGSGAAGGVGGLAAGGSGGAGGCDCTPDETCVQGACVSDIELVSNGDFSSDADDWSQANNAVNDEDITVLWDVVNGVCESEASSGPSARVLYQDLSIPTLVVSAEIRFDFAQDVTATLDPQNVSVIEKDPYDNSMSGGNQNAFRIDIISPDEDVFYAPILLEVYTPESDVGALDDLQPQQPQLAGLDTLLQDYAGATLRLRVAQVESTFPWPSQIDNISLKVLGAP